MADRPDPAPQPDAGSGRIKVELPCRGCRYTLIGLAITERCPECGLPVEESLHASIDLETIDGAGLPNPRLVSVAVGLLAIGALLWALGSTVLRVADTAASFGLPDPVTGIAPWFIGGCGLPCLLAAMVLVRQARAGWPGLASRPGTNAIVLGGVAAILVTALGPQLHQTVVLILRSIIMLLLVFGLCDIVDRTGRRTLAYRRAGAGIQTRTPLLLALSVEILATPLGDSELVRILGLTASSLVLIGMFYLVANSIWATLPLLRDKHRYRDLVSGRTQPNRD